MIRWNNDYNHGAHPAIIKAFQDRNDESFEGYGLDEVCEEAKAEIKKYLGDTDVDIHFLVGGTQTNLTVISSALRPFQSVISINTGHINCHETGAIENSGHKVQAIPGVDGKLTAEGIRKEAEYFRDSDIQEHITEPKMVYISFPTEYGTLYSKQELMDIRALCDEFGYYLFIDGARLGYGLGSSSCEVTIDEIAAIADVFYIGGTKCGAMFGEAVVIRNDKLKKYFRSYIKMNGGMLAKGWTLGLQFLTLFKDGLYFEITKHACETAARIADAFKSKGFKMYFESPTNQQFVVVNTEQMNKIGEKHIYEYDTKIDDDTHVIRFCTSWSTRDEDVETLIEDILNM